MKLKSTQRKILHTSRIFTDYNKWTVYNECCLTDPSSYLEWILHSVVVVGLEQNPLGPRANGL